MLTTTTNEICFSDLNNQITSNNESAYFHLAEVNNNQIYNLMSYFMFLVEQGVVLTRAVVYCHKSYQSYQFFEWHTGNVDVLRSKSFHVNKWTLCQIKNML